MKPRTISETKPVTINGRQIPGPVVASVRERMKARRFAAGEVIGWMKEAGLQGLAAVSLYAEFIKRELKAGRIREEGNLLVAVVAAAPVAGDI